MGRILAAIILALLCVSGDLLGQSSCLTNADTAAQIDQAVEQVVTLSDSATLAAQGLPYRPTGGAVLVTNNQVCSKVVSAINGLVPAGDPRRISSAYVFKVGQSTYAGVGNKSSLAKVTMTFLDSKYKWLAAMAALN